MNARQTLMTNYSFSNSECWRASGRNFQTTIYGNTGCRFFKKGRGTIGFNTSYLTDSYIIFTLKMESVPKNPFFGLKMRVKTMSQSVKQDVLRAWHLCGEFNTQVDAKQRLIKINCINFPRFKGLFLLIPTQDTKPSFGRSFVSKWGYNFWPAKQLCTYQDIFFSFHSNITQWVVNGKKYGQKPLNPRGTFFADQLYFFWFDQFLPSDEQ